jgi:hypothetical protein
MVVDRIGGGDALQQADLWIIDGPRSGLSNSLGGILSETYDPGDFNLVSVDEVSTSWKVRNSAGSTVNESN